MPIKMRIGFKRKREMDEPFWHEGVKEERMAGPRVRNRRRGSTSVGASVNLRLENPFRDKLSSPQKRQVVRGLAVRVSEARTFLSSLGAERVDDRALALMTDLLQAERGMLVGSIGFRQSDYEHHFDKVASRTVSLLQSDREACDTFLETILLRGVIERCAGHLGDSERTLRIGRQISDRRADFTAELALTQLAMGRGGNQMTRSRFRAARQLMEQEREAFNQAVDRCLAPLRATVITEQAEINEVLADEGRRDAQLATYRRTEQNMLAMLGLESAPRDNRYERDRLTQIAEFFDVVQGEETLAEGRRLLAAVYNFRALHQLRLVHTEEAAIYYDYAVVFNPNDGFLHANLALALGETGDFAGARRHFARVDELFAGTRFALTSETRVRRARFAVEGEIQRRVAERGETATSGELISADELTTLMAPLVAFRDAQDLVRPYGERLAELAVSLIEMGVEVSVVREAYDRSELRSMVTDELFMAQCQTAALDRLEVMEEGYLDRFLNLVERLRAVYGVEFVERAFGFAEPLDVTEDAEGEALIFDGEVVREVLNEVTRRVRDGDDEGARRLLTPLVRISAEVTEPAEGNARVDDLLFTVADDLREQGVSLGRLHELFAEGDRELAATFLRSAVYASARARIESDGLSGYAAARAEIAELEGLGVDTGSLRERIDAQEVEDRASAAGQEEILRAELVRLYTAQDFAGIRGLLTVVTDREQEDVTVVDEVSAPGLCLAAGEELVARGMEPTAVHSYFIKIERAAVGGRVFQALVARQTEQLLITDGLLGAVLARRMMLPYERERVEQLSSWLRTEERRRLRDLCSDEARFRTEFARLYNLSRAPEQRESRYTTDAALAALFGLLHYGVTSARGEVSDRAFATLLITMGELIRDNMGGLPGVLRVFTGELAESGILVARALVERDVTRVLDEEGLQGLETARRMIAELEALGPATAEAVAALMTIMSEAESRLTAGLPSSPEGVRRRVGELLAADDRVALSELLADLVARPQRDHDVQRDLDIRIDGVPEFCLAAGYALREAGRDWNRIVAALGGTEMARRVAAVICAAEALEIVDNCLAEELASNVRPARQRARQIGENPINLSALAGRVQKRISAVVEERKKRQKEINRDPDKLVPDIERRVREWGEDITREDLRREVSRIVGLCKKQRSPAVRVKFISDLVVVLEVLFESGRFVLAACFIMDLHENLTNKRKFIRERETYDSLVDGYARLAGATEQRRQVIAELEAARAEADGTAEIGARTAAFHDLFYLFRDREGIQEIYREIIGPAATIVPVLVLRQVRRATPMLFTAKLEQAITIFEEVFRFVPGYWEIGETLVRHHLARGLSQQASQVLSRLGDDFTPSHPMVEAQVTLLRADLELHNLQVAAKAQRGGADDGRLREIFETLHELLTSARRIIEEQDLDYAHPHFERFANLNSEAISSLAQAQFLTGRREEALATFQAAIDTQPTTATTHLDYASALKEVGREEEAVVVLQEAVENFPSSRRAAARLAESLYPLGRYFEVASMMRRAIPEANGDPVHMAARADALIQLGREIEAIGLCLSATNLIDLAREELSSKGVLTESRDKLLSRKLGVVHFQLASACRGLKRFARAEDSYRESMEQLRRSGMDKQTELLAVQGLAKVFSDQERYEEKLEFIDGLLATDADYVIYNWIRFETLMELDRFADMIPVAEKLIRAGHATDDLVYNLAASAAANRGDAGHVAEVRRLLQEVERREGRVRLAEARALFAVHPEALAVMPAEVLAMLPEATVEVAEIDMTSDILVTFRDEACRYRQGGSNFVNLMAISERTQDFDAARVQYQTLVDDLVSAGDISRAAQVALAFNRRWKKQPLSLGAFVEACKPANTDLRSQLEEALADAIRHMDSMPLDREAALNARLFGADSQDSLPVEMMLNVTTDELDLRRTAIFDLMLMHRTAPEYAAFDRVLMQGVFDEYDTPMPSYVRRFYMRGLRAADGSVAGANPGIAVVILSRVLAMVPESYEALVVCAIQMADLGELDLAEQTARIFLEQEELSRYGRLAGHNALSLVFGRRGLELALRGQVHDAQAHYLSALEHVDQGLEWLEEADGENSTGMNFMATLYSNRGFVLLGLRRPDEAMVAFRYSMERGGKRFSPEEIEAYAGLLRAAGAEDYIPELESLGETS